MSQQLSITQSLAYFRDKRLLSVFFFGLASGFPWVLIGSAMSGWLKDEGLSRSSIGLFGLIFVAYSINFLWSPLLDRIKIFWLTKRFGQRRSWILLTQLVIVLATWQMSLLQANLHLSVIALFGLVVAISGATQDIAVDAYRIDTLNNSDISNKNHYMAAGSAMATAGWWTGYAGLGSIPFILVDLPNWEWPEVYMVLAAIMLLLMLTAFFVKEPISNREIQQKAIETEYIHKLSNQNNATLMLSMLLILPTILITILYANFNYPAWPDELISKEQQFLIVTLFIIALAMTFIKLLLKLNKQVNSSTHSTSDNITISAPNKIALLTAWLLTTLVAPIQEFFDRNGVKLAISILLFIFLFKLGEAYLGRMSIVFYREVGFSNSDIAYYSKLINWGVTIVFSLVGSVFTIRYGILKGLFIGGIAMSASNLLFAVMAMVGPDKSLFALTVFVDGFTSAWGSVAFVALLSVLCNKSFTASQYALMASLGTFGRVMLGSYSGVVVDWLDGNWAMFFVLTSLMVTPSLLFLYAIRKPLTRLIEQGDSKA